MKYLTEQEVAEVTKISIQTLRNARSRGNKTGVSIPYVKIGRMVRYEAEDVEAFMKEYKVNASQKLGVQR